MASVISNTNDYDSKERRTVITLELSSFGTKDQQEQTLEKFKSEVALQGFKVNYTNIVLW